MQTLGHSAQRAASGPQPSLLERAAWTDKLPLTLVCGVLLGFSSAGYGVWWLAWLGLTPLILLVFACASRTQALLTGLLFGLAYHLVAMHWLLDLHPLSWLGMPVWASLLVAGQAWVLESLHQSVLFALFALFVYTLPMRAGFLPHYERPFFPMLLSIPIIWVFLQWMVAPSPLFLGVPIDQLAYSQSRMPAAIQIASLGGAQLVDFLLVLFNCALAALIMECTNIASPLPSRADLISDRMGAIFDVIVVGTLALVSFAWGQAQVRADAAMPAYRQDKAHFAPAIPVAVAQPNLNAQQQTKWSGKQVSAQLMPLIDNLGVSLIVLPAGILNPSARGTEPLWRQLPDIALTQRKDILAGYRLKTSDGIEDGVRLFSADKFNKDTVYNKYRLLPVIEYTPLQLLDLLLPQALRDGVSGGGKHITADKLTTVRSVFGRVGTSIGAEIVYPDLIVSQTNRGASVLINVCDLSVFHGPALGQQLLAAACLRAVESGRYLMLASNGGVSAIIDPHGITTSTSIQGRQGVLVDRVQFLHGKTPFARMCLWTPLYH